MGGTDRQTGSWKEKFVHELVEYVINVIYLTLVFAAFTQYRRLVWLSFSILSSMRSRASGRKTDSLAVLLSSLTRGRTNYSPDPW